MPIAIPAPVSWSCVTASGKEGLSVPVTKLTPNSQLHVSAQIRWKLPPSQFSLWKGRHKHFLVCCAAPAGESHRLLAEVIESRASPSPRAAVTAATCSWWETVISAVRKVN